MTAHTIEEYKDYTIEIYQDGTSDSPRDWDNLGFMACWHRRMWLGDKPKEVQKYTPEGWFTDIVKEHCWKSIEQSEGYEEWVKGREEWEDEGLDTYIDDWMSNDLPLLFKYIEKDFVILPIHAYEHSEITISTGRKSCWDSFESGQLGFIYVSKKSALKEFNQKVWTKTLENKVVKILEGEVETYDQYLTGDVHGFTITAPDGRDVESVWGFYGTDECLKEAKRVVDWDIANEKKQAKLLNVCMSL